MEHGAALYWIANRGAAAPAFAFPRGSSATERIAVAGAGALARISGGVWGSRSSGRDVYAKNPESWRANVQLGLTAFERNRCWRVLREGAAPCLLTISKGPSHLNYANALDGRGKRRPNSKKSLEIEDRATTWTQLGVFYGKQQRYTGHWTGMTRTQRWRGTRISRWRTQTGECYARLGDCEKATGDFENALRLMPSNTTAQRGLAYCRERMRQ